MNNSWRTTVKAESGNVQNERTNVLLVTVDWNRELSKTPMLGPALLIANSRRDPLIRSRVDFEIKQFSIDHLVEEIIEEILCKQYDVVGFSNYIWNHQILEQVIPVLKQVYPDTTIIVGGPQLLEQERIILQQIPDIDVLVYKDGETAFTDILHQVINGKNNWAEVRGILSNVNGHLIDTYDKRVSINYADTASPYIEGVITGHHKNLFLITYRGCSGRCAYCAWCGNEMNKLELLPLDRVKKEMEIIKSMGATSVGIFDSNFNHPPERALQIFDLILDTGQIDLVGNHLYAQSLHEDLIERMAKVKTLVGVGLQTTYPETNKLMRRRLMIEKMTAGLHLMKQYDIHFTMQMIIGLPGDSYNTIAETLNYALQFRPPKMDAFRLMILPGTEYKRRAEEYNLVYEPRPNYYVISHHTMNAKEINKAERMAQALTLFYNQPNSRALMYRMAVENHESIIQFCDAAGSFIHHFNLIDQNELRKGDIVRIQDEQFLIRILNDFKKFRKELAGKSIPVYNYLFIKS